MFSNIVISYAIIFKLIFIFNTKQLILAQVLISVYLFNILTVFNIWLYILYLTNSHLTFKFDGNIG